MPQLRIVFVVGIGLWLAGGCSETEPDTGRHEASAVIADGGVPRRASWSYWDRGGDLGTVWRAASYDDSAWARGAGPLGYGESYLQTLIGYGGDPDHKHVTTYFRTQFTVADAAAVQAMRGELMFDDGVVVYLNGQEIGRAAMPSGTITAATLSSGHESGNAYQGFDWSAMRGLLRSGVNTLAVEVHQVDRTSSDLTFDLSLTLTVAAPPVDEHIARGSVWRYWDRGGDLGTAWRGAVFDDAGWAQGPGPLGYGESYHATTISYGGDPTSKHLTTYFRHRFFVADPAQVGSMIAEVLYDDGIVVYINGHELGRWSMPAGPITAATRAFDHEPGGYETYEWSAAARPLMVPGVNVIAIEVHQTGPASSDLTFDLSLTLQNGPRQPSWRRIDAGAVWGVWDRGGDLGTAWRAPGYAESGWRNGPAPLGFGESYIATPTAAGHVTTYLRHDFYRHGSPTNYVLEARYDDGFIAYLNGTEVLRVGLPGGTVNASTLAAGHEAGGYERFVLPGAEALVGPGLNTLAIEVHQHSTSSSDLVWDARLIDENPWPVMWTRQDSGTTRSLHDVWFVDAQRGWVVGDGGTVLRTTDGGATWVAQAIGSNDGLYAVEFADVQRGWIAGRDGIRATTDGGATWVLQTSTWAFDLSFVDAQTGWASSSYDGLLHTTDGGATWQTQLVDPDLSIGNVDFADALNGWATGRVEASGGNVIFRTSDGGATWVQQLAAGGWEEGFGAIDAVSPTLACAVGVGANHTRLGELKFITRDGVHWGALPESSNRTALSDVDFVDASVAWAVGYAGSIIRTDDGGDSWSVEETARWEYFEDHSRSSQPTLTAVHALDARNAWAVGAGGTILVTHR